MVYMLGFTLNLDFAQQVETQADLPDNCSKSGWQFEKFSISEGCMYSWTWGKVCAHQLPPCLKVNKQVGIVLHKPSAANTAQR